MTTSQKILSIVSAVVALVLVFVKLYWPALADPITQISVAVVACLAAILAVVYPVSAAVVAMRRNYAAAGAVRRLPGPGNVDDDISDLMNAIYQDLDDNNIPYKAVDASGQVTIDPVPVAPRISQALTNVWNSISVSMSFKLKLLDTALTICSTAYTEITGIKAPATWSECADYNAYWRAHMPDCKIHSAGLFRQALMPIRTCLKVKDTGDI
jgi:hypothetical protein